MHYNPLHTRSLPLLAIGFLLILSSCGPVHMFTRVKKTPREYSLNYCADEIRAPRTDLNKEPWIVFSDHEKNQSYNRAGGKVKLKEIEYLEPFLVIGRKKDHLKLIKYEPTILKNGKLDYKKAEYYGWIPKNDLLLNRQSVTDLASGKKNKMLVLFSDTLSLPEPEKFFETDSVKTYKDPTLNTPSGFVAPHTVIYPLKTLPEQNRTLISKTPVIVPEEAEENILGWIDHSLITPLGTGLHVNTTVFPATEELLDGYGMVSQQYPVFQYSPVSSYSVKDSLVAFKTRLPLPLFDYSRNYISNVNGSPITHKEFRSITKELKKIHITFVFEGKEETITQFPQMVNALQGLQTLFEETAPSYSFRFNSILAFDHEIAWQPQTTGFTSDYTEFINSLSDKATQKEPLKPILSNQPWAGLQQALLIIEKEQPATNLIVLIGEKGTLQNSPDSLLTEKLLHNNCRIAGFQVYADEGNEYNNFVLDIESMISKYAEGMLLQKRELLVVPEQIKRSNEYRQADESGNNYRLDFPDNSITQGGIFFPRKGEALPMELLSQQTDTLVQQIIADNNSMIAYMSNAFRTAGQNRTQFDSHFTEYFGINPAHLPQKKIINSFTEEIPAWYMPSKIIVVNETMNKEIDYSLLLSESEKKETADFIAALSEKELESIDPSTKKRKKKKQKPCNCPEDDLFSELEKENREGEVYNLLPENPMTETDTITVVRYANTGKIRKHLTKTYLTPIRYCKVCKEKKSTLKALSLAQAHYRITGCPTVTEQLQTIRIKDLKNKKVVSDAQLEELINYYKEMKQEIEGADSFESAGETYYWVEQKQLP